MASAHPSINPVPKKHVTSTKSQLETMKPSTQNQLELTPVTALLASKMTTKDNQARSKPVQGGFKPFQMLMETEVTIEYGQQLQSKRVIHQEMLCCYSKKQSDLFHSAKKIRATYQKADQMRKQLKAFVDANISFSMIEEENKEDEIIQIIMLIWREYPIERMTHIRRFIDAKTAEQIQVKRNVIDKTVLKKDIQGLGIHARLEALNADGLLSVARSLAGELKLGKRREHEAAQSNTTKAAAQRRIILPDANERVVRSLSSWLYGQGLLTYEDAEHLYALQALAEKLGITDLAEQCLYELVSKTEGTFQAALHRGLGLQHFLDLAPSETTPGDCIVQVAIQHVLKEEDAPERLRDLIVDILAQHLDPDIWANLRSMTNGQVALSIVDAMIRRRQIKKELFEAKTGGGTS